METVKKLFAIVFIALFFIVAYKVVPIYYKALAIRSLCKDHADRVHRYDKTFTSRALEYDLAQLGIPKSQREHTISVTKDAVVVKIYYEDTANFFDYYQRDFQFFHECQGVLDSVITQ